MSPATKPTITEVVVEELWIRAVTRMPSITPTMGLERKSVCEMRPPACFPSIQKYDFKLESHWLCLRLDGLKDTFKNFLQFPISLLAFFNKLSGIWNSGSVNLPQQRLIGLEPLVSYEIRRIWKSVIWQGRPNFIKMIIRCNKNFNNNLKVQHILAWQWVLKLNISYGLTIIILDR